MHCLQVQDAAVPQALQAVRTVLLLPHLCTDFVCSFELGGEKKTKGAALTFVRPISSLVLAVYSRISPTVIVSLVVVLSLFLFPHHLSTHMPRIM